MTLKNNTKPKIDVYAILKFNVKLLRASRDMTAEQLSINLDWTKKRLSDIESKVGTSPSVYEVYQIAAYFDVTIDELLHERGRVIFNLNDSRL